MPLLLTLKDDKAVSLRKKLCLLLEQIVVKVLTKDDIDTKLQIINVFDEMKTSSNHEVSEAGFVSEERAVIKFKETDASLALKIDAEKKLLAFEK